MTTTQHNTTATKISDEKIIANEAETARLIKAGYDAAEEIDDLEEDWEDKIVEAAYNQVWGSWDAYEAAIR